MLRPLAPLACRTAPGVTGITPVKEKPSPNWNESLLKSPALVPLMLELAARPSLPLSVALSVPLSASFMSSGGQEEPPVLALNT